MGSQVSKQVARRKAISTEKKALCDLHGSCGDTYPGSDYRPADRKNWMGGLNPEKVHINKIVWPGTHDSATNKIGFPLISRPFAQCQSLSIYQQLCRGARVLDIRVQEDRRICHGILKTYSVDVVINDVKKFLSEAQSEIIILEIRTEFGHEDPADFDKYLEEQLGEYLIHQDDHVFGKTIAELLPKRIICIWKPRKSPQPKHGGPLWSAGYLKDNWIDTDLPSTKFESNMKHLNRLQIFSTDFIDEDFVDACVGLTHARIEGKA
ncbi:hypothetical protein GH714_030221 [Hevea brasiliensis]|uniref:Phosphatidylinositol-specific phospholipase C X domain-containing protein n=1 Tax=Hevea brasiliensis TaxID=3981 RepID=A0A6A6NCS2_HEVBR|nr:hypothetical protein GH714_030221 [Hevea brasiliensis]